MTPDCLAQAPASRPAAAAPSTEADFYKESVPYFRGLLGELYDRSGRKNPKWDAAAAKFLEDMAFHLAGQTVRRLYRPADRPTAEALIKAGNDILALGCDDPLIPYCLGELNQELNRRQPAIDMYRRAGHRNALSKQSDILSFRMTAQMTELKAIMMSFDKGSSHLALVSGPLTNVARRHRFRLIQDAKKPTQWHEQLVDAMKAAPNTDPWLRDVLAGKLHIDLAWDARGGGFADTVTEEGWKGFFANLSLARDCLTRAHKLAPELPESATAMITVAMGGSERLNEDPAKWFAMATAAQADYRPAFSRFHSALLPRWGGSYEQMLAVGFKGLQNPRYDTLIPWEFIEAVEAIGDDMGDAWTLIENPKVYALMTQVLEGYTKACGPGRGNYFASAQIAVAIHAGKIEDARKMQDAWKAAGGELDWRAFEYFGFDDGPDTASMVYALTGATKADLVKVGRLLDDEKEADALATLRAIKESLKPEDPALVYINGMIARLARTTQFEAGEWVRLPTTMPEWRQSEGKWYADGMGGLVSSLTDYSKGKTLLYAGEIPLDPRAGFEFSVVLEGALESSDPKPGPGRGPSAGISFYSMQRPFYRGWVIVELGKPFGEFAFGNDRVRFDIQPKNEPELTVRCKDYVLTAFLNGKQVGEPFTLPDRYRQNMQVGVGGSNGASIRFSNIRVRNLTKVKE